MIVVPVLITNCHVSLNPKIGPVTPHTTMIRKARKNVPGRPVARAVHLAKRVKCERGFVGRMALVGHRVQQNIDPERVARRRELIEEGRVLSLALP